jgi:hypothetical protein
MVTSQKAAPKSRS